MRKSIIALGLIMAFSITSITTAFASEWKQDVTGWKVQNENGSYLTSSWYQSPTSGLWYYIGADGYMLTNTTTPDGYTVDINGVWIMEQTSQQTSTPQPAPQPTPQPTQAPTPEPQPTPQPTQPAVNNDGFTQEEIAEYEALKESLGLGGAPDVEVMQGIGMSDNGGAYDWGN